VASAFDEGSDDFAEKFVAYAVRGLRPTFYWQESDPDETIPTQVPPQYFMAVPSGQL
jgi:hypothetical protein